MQNTKIRKGRSKKWREEERGGEIKKQEKERERRRREGKKKERKGKIESTRKEKGLNRVKET